MRANNSLHQSFDSCLEFLHARRRAALWRCVMGLMLGGRLWLSSLGRSLPGATSDKHRIKAADRFLGNRAIHRSSRAIYAALASWLLRKAKSVVVAIDWTGIGPHHYILSAAVCHRGRTIPIYSRVYSKRRVNNPAVERKFLDELAQVIPASCTPIIVTDAGFRLPWLDAVQSHGWHFVSRVRNRTKVLQGARWKSLRTIRKTAGRRARSLGTLTMRKSAPREHRLILGKIPRLKGRKRRTRSGSVGRRTEDRKRSQGTRQPWLLATSLSCRPDAVMAVYALRMQIEQTFRDLKNRRNGWALSDVRSRSSNRIETLLLCAAIACLGLRLVSAAAETAELHRGLQANTVTSRRVLSLFAVARLLLKNGYLPSPVDLRRAVRQLQRELAAIPPKRRAG